MLGGVSRYASLGSATIAHRELTIHLGGMSFGLLGLSKFGLFSVAGDPGSLAMFMFAVVFMDTAATIATGALAERWKFSAFFIYGLFMSMLLYPLYGNWVWGGGWLSQLGINFGLGHGHVDFAGSSVVHMTGGVTALAGTLVLGPRIGKFRRNRVIGAMPGHNLPMAMVGTLILAFGWFGFNCGSTLAASDSRIALIAVNTMLSSAAGAIAALMAMWLRYKRPDIGITCNGLLGGLVAITGVLRVRVAVVGAIDRSGRRIDHGLERNHARAPSACGRPGWRDRGARSLRIVGRARARDFRRRQLRDGLEWRTGNRPRLAVRRPRSIRGPAYRRDHQPDRGLRIWRSRSS